jgi:polyphosphate kinase
MSRNMFRRIELAWPVRDPVLRQRVFDEALVPYLYDEKEAWVLDSVGRYRRVGPEDGQGASAQQALMVRYA